MEIKCDDLNGGQLAKQLDIFVQGVPRATNMNFAKFKCIRKGKYLSII